MIYQMTSPLGTARTADGTIVAVNDGTAQMSGSAVVPALYRFCSLSEPGGMLRLACLKTWKKITVCFRVKDFSTEIHNQFMPSLFKGLQL